ncbi:MAG: hypothetical protein RSG59_05430 [Ruthenibacterium sp.]
MQKFIPFEKQSKKQQRAWNAAKRGTWSTVNPVTRTVESKKIYSQKKLRSQEQQRSSNGVFILCA